MSIRFTAFAQQNERVTYAVSIGYFSIDSLQYIFPYVNDYLKSGFGKIYFIKVKSNKYRVLAGYKIDYNEALELLENTKRSKLNSKHTHLIAFNCSDEVSLEEADKLNRNINGTVENVISTSQIENDSISFVDKFLYKVLAFSNIDSIQIKNFHYLKKRFKNDDILIEAQKSCDGKNTILYTVYIGNFICVNEANDVREKLLTDGYLFSMVNGEKTPIYIFNCIIKKGRRGSILHNENNNCN